MRVSQCSTLAHKRWLSWLLSLYLSQVFPNICLFILLKIHHKVLLFCNYLNDKLEVKRSQFQMLNDNTNILNNFCIYDRIKPKSFGMRCAWLWADTWKAQGGYKKLLLFFFYCASDQKLGKYKTAGCYRRLCSLLKILKSLVLVAVSYKMDWRICKCLRPSNSSVLPEPGLHEERCSAFETGIFKG